ncbi:MAG: hypothetical protein V4591_08450 [Bdellovibrionota bacterium]
MTLNANLLGKNLFEVLTKTDPSKTEEICINMAKIIIEHIQQNGEVNVAVQTSSGSGTGTGKMS